jgi:hypothetical protein
MLAHLLIGWVPPREAAWTNEGRWTGVARMLFLLSGSESSAR